MKPVKTEYKALTAITAGTIAVLSIAACSIASSNTSDTTVPSESETTVETTFSDNDLNAGYDEIEAQIITLNGTSASSDSSSKSSNSSSISS